MRRTLLCRHGLLLTLALALAAPAAADAQVRRGRPLDTAPRWAPPSIGVAFGYDQRADGEVLKAQARLPIVRSGKFELVPHGELIYPRLTREEQYGVELSWIPAGIRRGAYISAGVAWRRTVLGRPPGDPKDAFFGISTTGGLKSRAGPVEIDISFRWVFLRDTTYQPNSAAIGVNLPFWSVGPSGP